MHGIRAEGQSVVVLWQHREEYPGGSAGGFLHLNTALSDDYGQSWENTRLLRTSSNYGTPLKRVEDWDLSQESVNLLWDLETRSGNSSAASRWRKGLTHVYRSSIGHQRLSLDADSTNLVFAMKTPGRNAVKLSRSWNSGDTVETYVVGGGLKTTPTADCLTYLDEFYAVIASSKGGPGGQNLYFTRENEAGGRATAIVRIDQDTSDLGQVVPGSAHLLGIGGILYCAYRETGRNGGAADQQECYLLASADKGTTWTETLISPAATNTRGYSVDASATVLAACWIEEHDNRVRIATSTDSGASFSTPHLIAPGNGPGRDFHVAPEVFVDGNRIVVAYFTDEHTVSDTDYSPSYVYSIDRGETWSSPLRLRTESWSNTPVLDFAYSDGALHAAVQDDRVVLVTGVRFPLMEAPVILPHAVGVRMHGIDPFGATPPLARWAVSTIVGGSQHPENPSGFIDLGRSPELRYSLGHPKKFSASVRPDGSASALIRVPTTFKGTLFLQGWVNRGGVNGGSAPSDYVEVLL